MQRIIGIDPGSYRTGYGVVLKEGRTLSVLASGTIRLSASAPIHRRLAQLQHQLEAIFAEHQPDLVAIEDVFSHRNPRTALVLGQARGVALAVAGCSGAEVEAFPPATVKRAVAGNGRATKEQVRRMVQVLLALSALPAEDEADALAVALCRASMGQRPPAPAVPAAIVAARRALRARSPRTR